MSLYRLINLAMLPVVIAITLVTSLATTVVAQNDPVKLKLYTTRQEYLFKPILDAYSKKTGVTFDVLYGDDAMVERLRLEGKQSPADLIVAADAISLLTIRSLFAKADDGKELIIPLAQRYRIFYASKSLSQDQRNSLTSYDSLLDPQWKGKVCIRSLQHPYNIGLVATLIAAEGKDKAMQWLKDLKPQLARKPAGSDRTQVEAIKNGFCSVSVGNHYYLFKMLEDADQKAWAESVDPIFPTAPALTYTGYSAAGILATSSRQDAAKAFVDYLLSPEGQEQLILNTYEYPITPNVSISQELKSILPDKIQESSFDDIMGYMDDAVTIINESMIDF